MLEPQERDTVRIVIADDDPRVRTRLRGLIAAEPTCCLIGEAGDGLQALALVTRTKPDVLLLDLEMPRMDGWQVLEDLRQSRHRVRMVVRGRATEESVRRAVLAAGAADYVTDTTDLVRVAKSVLGT